MTTANATSPFAALLDEIEGLAKALPADEGKDGEGEGEGEGEGTAEDDAKIAAAAAEGEEGEGDDEGKPFGKSFKLKLDDGTEIDAVDGGELLKSLMARVESNEAGVVEVVGGLTAVIASQGTLLKSLQAKVDALAGSGRGRKAVITINEKPAPTAEALAAAQEPKGMDPTDFMAKALSSQAAGKISGGQVAELEAHINMGVQPPPHLVKIVLGE